jgi:hypothetical protein
MAALQSTIVAPHPNRTDTRSLPYQLVDMEEQHRDIRILAAMGRRAAMEAILMEINSPHALEAMAG